MITPRFLGDTVLRPIPTSECRERDLPTNKQLWELMQALGYQSAEARVRLTIPAGFVTDLGSTPRWPVVYWFTGGVIFDEAVLHDFLYGTHLSETRACGDLVLDEAMGVRERTAWRRWLILKGVQIGGAKAWASGPSRLTILNHENDLPEIAALGVQGFQLTGLLEFCPSDTAFA